MDFLCHSIFSGFVLQGFVRNSKSTLFSKVYRVYCKGILLFIHKNHEGPSKQEGFKKNSVFLQGSFGSPVSTVEIPADAWDFLVSQRSGLKRSASRPLERSAADLYSRTLGSGANWNLWKFLLCNQKLRTGEFT